MLLTIFLAIVFCASITLMLISAVACVQDIKFFSSAPKEIVEAVPQRKERFPGAHVIGWMIIVIAFLTFLGAFLLGAWDGIMNHFGFTGFFVRFLVMLYGMEVFDIIFFDWVLLCLSGFFPHYYPEVKDIVGPHLFGYNWKTHLLHFIIYIPAAAVIAWVCTLF